MKNSESHFEKNLEYLFSNNIFVAGQPADLDIFSNPPEEWRKTLNTIKSAGYQKNGIRFHSQRDPEREARRQVEFTAKEGKTHLILLSAGIGYPFDEALKLENIESVLLLETNPEILFYCLALFPFYKTRKSIMIYFCKNPELDTLEGILPFFQNKNVAKIAFYRHRVSFQVSPEQSAILEHQVSEILYKRSINQATILKFQAVWNKNIGLNIRQLINGKPLSWLIEQFRQKSKNIVICGAGPSLSESYDELKIHRSRYLLIAADTAFIPLATQGIYPDIVISADPQWINHYFALHRESRKSIWVLDPVLCYESSHFLDRQNALMVWWDNPFYLDSLIRNGKSRGEISHGGSVSTNAFDLAVKLSPESIILVGQDLAFSRNLAHVKGSALESMIYHKNNRFGGFELHNYRQLTAIPPRTVSSTIQNEKGVFTNDKLLVFANWFESQSAKVLAGNNIRLYNATRHGARLQNFEHITLTEILAKMPGEYAAKTAAMENRDESVPINDSLPTGLKTLLKDCRKIQDLYHANFKLATLSVSGSTAKIAELNGQMNGNDEKIRQYRDLNSILSINAQSIILKITELEDRRKDSEVLFYKLMYLSARKLNYLLMKMIYILSQTAQKEL